MGLIDRVGSLFRANLNSFMRSAEDPEKILIGVVYQMQDDLVQLRQLVAQAIAMQKRTERQIAQAQSTAEEWYRRAQIALQSGNETLARDALTKRRAYQQTATELSHQMEEQNTLVAKLKTDMRTLELKVGEAKNQKDMYIARARSAEASYKLREMLSYTGSVSNQTFARMEEKVVLLEAQSEVIALADTEQQHSSFASLEFNSDVDVAAIKPEHVEGIKENLKPAH
ncbi:PspA/IM30 family protein [Iningainema tapete]|uniref:PspA/IM30 family protein n=1 Tax=Iningainema tapete BLCC-T55 TaxID=2748662 RepID=A0A8J7BW69_9CYAN|nr:PspA/IM30 family protein [Iningainema tapete]MBD2771227.1 PspA/IM30 family protein [Iningainema tapete BLCC-T55]